MTTKAVSPPGPTTIPVILTPRLLLTILPPSEAPRLVAYATENADHLTPWEPPPPPGYYTEAFWTGRLERNREELERDQSLRLTLTVRHDPEGPILGHCNFNQFVRGAFQACILGYSLDHRFVGQGIMTEALKGAIAYVFGTLGFHRIMANHLPTNERSGRLLRRLGFIPEGYARDYVFINGAWRDHVLTALTNPAPADPPLSSNPRG
jgi:[ribosomal protein S5]-alanine N-acetyltransferase